LDFLDPAIDVALKFVEKGGVGEESGIYSFYCDTAILFAALKGKSSN
jgi:hypothetical protein